MNKKVTNKKVTNAVTYRTQSVIYDGHRFFLMPAMTSRDWIKSNSLVWNVKGWFKSSIFELVNFFQPGLRDHNWATYTNLKPQICRRFIRHHMRADINPDNLTLIIKNLVTLLALSCGSKYELGNWDTSQQPPWPRRRSQIHSPRSFVGCWWEEIWVSGRRWAWTRYAVCRASLARPEQGFSPEHTIKTGSSKKYGLKYLVDRSERCLVL